MFMSAMIFTRLTSAGAIAAGSSTTSFRAPSMRKRMRRQSSEGSMCTSDARSRIGCVDERRSRCVGLGRPQVDHRNVKLLAQRTGDVLLAEQTEIDEDRAEPVSRVRLYGGLDRVAGDRTGLHEYVADARARLGD